MLTTKVQEGTQKSPAAGNSFTPSLHIDTSRSTRARLSENLGLCEVPATPDLSLKEHNSQSEEMKYYHKLDDVTWRRSGNKAELSEDPLEDFKREREERRKGQMGSLSGSLIPDNLIPVGRSDPLNRMATAAVSHDQGERSDKGQRSGECEAADQGERSSGNMEQCQRATKLCAVTINGKNSLIRIMKPIGILIPDGRTKSSDRIWKGTSVHSSKVEGPNIGLYLGSVCEDGGQVDAVVPGGTISHEKSCSKERNGEQNIKDHNSTHLNEGEPVKGQVVKSQNAEYQNIVNRDDIVKMQKGLAQATIESRGESTIKTNNKGETLQYQNCKGQGHTSQSVTGQEAVTATADKLLKNGSNSTVFKAAKFTVNGEVFFLIPAEADVNQVQRVIQGQMSTISNQRLHKPEQRLRDKMPRGQRTAQSEAICNEHRQHQHGNNSKNSKENLEETSCEMKNPMLRVKSVVHVENFLHFRKGCVWFTDEVIPRVSRGSPSFTILKSTIEEMDEVDSYQNQTLKGGSLFYPSIRKVKHSRRGRSVLRISRLAKGQLSSKGGGQLQGQMPKEMDLVDSQSLRDEMQEERNSMTEEKGNPKGECLQFVISPTKAGTLIFTDRKHFQDMNEPPLWITTTLDKRRNAAADQVVPDLANCNDKYGKYGRAYQYWNSERAGGNEEMRLLLKEIKLLLEASNDIDKLGLITCACDFIEEMELRIKGILLELGCEGSGQTVADVLMRNKIITADNDIASEGDALPSTMNHSPEFLVPQLRNTPMNWRRETANGGLPEVPNLDRSTSPVLHIGGGSNWASRENQAHAPSQRRSDLPLSSHLSFSESLTDDSENLNEFDLLFENSPKHNGSNPKQNGSTRKQNGGTFHAYVNDVFEDIFIDDYDTCEKTTPKKSPDNLPLLGLTTPIGSLSSPPWCHLKSPPCNKTPPSADTPQSFSANSLDYKLHHETEGSPKWYQTVEQGVQYSDDLEVYQTNLSMKVIRNKACLEESRFEDDEREGEIARGCWNTNEDGLRKNAKTREQSKDRKDENDIDVYVNHIIDKEANLLQEDEDVVALKNLEQIAMQKSQHELPPSEQQKVIYAKDLMNSDLLASFLFPCQKFIPEDPFGIGAETVVEKTPDIAATKEDDDVTNTWQDNIDVTPPQPKRGFLPEPPKVGKEKSVKRRRGSRGDETIAVKRPHRRRDMVRLQKPEERSDSDIDDSDRDSVFVPKIDLHRNQENSHTQKNRAPMPRRKRKRPSKDSIVTASNKKKGKDGYRRIKTRKTRIFGQRRNALTSIN